MARYWEPIAFREIDGQRVKCEWYKCQHLVPYNRRKFCSRVCGCKAANIRYRMKRRREEGK